MARYDSPMPPNSQIGAEITRTWGELVVLPENRSAVRAARRVANALAKPDARRPVCPVVLHGPPGTGKSAIVQTLVRLVVGAAESRTVQALPAAELPRAAEDLADLRTCDLLALEDLQHLKSPDIDATCKLLDHRAARRRPTVVTCAVGPANLTTLPRRLTSRLAAGLVVRIDPPGPDSRKRLIERFADQRKVRLTPDALDWLATTTIGIRPLLGAIERLRTAGKKSATPLIASKVRDLLADPHSGRPDSPLDRITAKVCETFRVKPKDLTGDSRLRPVLVPRQVAMYLAREVAKLPLAKIGQHFGGRDHTTVRNAVGKIAEALASDAKLATTVRELRGGLG
jgi:chromosomal replication initiator protein